MANKWPSWRLSLTAVLTSLGTSFHFGLHLSITNPGEDAFIEFLNDTLYKHYHWTTNRETLMNFWSVIVSIFFVGGIIGSLLVRPIADNLGRKGGLLLMLALSAVSIVATLVAKLIARFELYTIARILMGCSATIGLCLAGMYLTECRKSGLQTDFSPKHCRGVVSMLIGAILQVGVLTGSVVAMPNLLGNTSRYCLIDASELVVTLLTFLAFMQLYESPSYLILCGDDAGAREAIRFFHRIDSAETKPIDGQSSIDRILNELREEIHIRKKSLGMLDFWRRADLCDRRCAIIGTVISMSMISSGITVMLAYSVEIFEKVGFDAYAASWANIIIMICGLISCLSVTPFVDRFGRRQILLITYILLLITQVVIVVCIKAYETLQQHLIGHVLVVTFVIFVVIFSIGPGPMGLFVTSEMLSQNSRTTGQSWALLIQMAGRSIMLAIFHPIQEAIGNGYAFLVLFLVPTFITLLAIYYHLPETKNRSVREIHEELNHLPKFDFMGTCTKKR